MIRRTVFVCLTICFAGLLLINAYAADNEDIYLTFDRDNWPWRYSIEDCHPMLYMVFLPIIRI